MKINELFENTGIKLICLLLAIVVWLYANTKPQTDMEQRGKIIFSGVSVRLEGIPQDEWKPKPEKISLEVECTTTEVAIGTFHVLVRLMSGDGAEKRVALTAENVKLPEGMIFVKAEPDEIELVR